MAKKALITGITGQDGSYLAEFLLGEGYEVHGLVRRAALENQQARLSRIGPIKDQLILHPGSLESYPSLLDVFAQIQPAECYHLAAQSFVQESFADPFTTFNINVNGTHYLLDALRQKSPTCRFYFAGSSEMFGKVEEIPQTERTPFHPRSPYGITKVTGFELTRYYREAFGIFACNGILFNHESPRRGFEFVTRKITQAIARINLNPNPQTLVLGNLSAQRDWGFAGDYVKAMWLMLQQTAPDDYVVATGRTHTVEEFVIAAFAAAHLAPPRLIDLHDLTEAQADQVVNQYRDDQPAVFQHPRFYRPAEVDLLLGDASKAQLKLGWQPEVTFEQLVRLMVEHDLRLPRSSYH